MLCCYGSGHQNAASTWTRSDPGTLLSTANVISGCLSALFVLSEPMQICNVGFYVLCLKVLKCYIRPINDKIRTLQTAGVPWWVLPGVLPPAAIFDQLMQARSRLFIAYTLQLTRLNSLTQMTLTSMPRVHFLCLQNCSRCLQHYKTLHLIHAHITCTCGSTQCLRQ